MFEPNSGIEDVKDSLREGEYENEKSFFRFTPRVVQTLLCKYNKNL